MCFLVCVIRNQVLLCVNLCVNKLSLRAKVTFSLIFCDSMPNRKLSITLNSIQFNLVFICSLFLILEFNLSMQPCTP